VVRSATSLPQSCCHIKIQYPYYSRASTIIGPFRKLPVIILSRWPRWHFVLEPIYKLVRWRGTVRGSCLAKRRNTTGMSRAWTHISRRRVQRRNNEATAPHTYINKSFLLARKYAPVLVRGHLLFREANSFVERSLRKTVSFEEQIISKDKYPGIFSLKSNGGY